MMSSDTQSQLNQYLNVIIISLAAASGALVLGMVVMVIFAYIKPSVHDLTVLLCLFTAITAAAAAVSYTLRRRMGA